MIPNSNVPRVIVFFDTTDRFERYLDYFYKISFKSARMEDPSGTDQPIQNPGGGIG